MRFNILVILSLFTLLYGCDRDEESGGFSGPEVRQIRFTLGAETYATDTRFEEGDLIGIYAVKKGSSLKAKDNYADNKKYRFDGQGLSPFSEEDKILYMQEDKLDFYAYYPFLENIDDATNLHFIVPEEQDDNITLSDLLWAVNTSAIMDKLIPLNFTHKLALVEVKFNSVSGKKPASAQFYGKTPAVSLNLQTGELKEKNSSRQLNKMFLDQTIGNSFIYRYIAPQQEINRGDTLFVFHVDGNTRTFKAGEDLVLKPGVKNQFECALQYRIGVEAHGEGNVYGGGIYGHGEQVTVHGRVYPDWYLVGWF
ncbi:fimbrillin family protein [Prevotella sp. 10(H)]|uniref:fimbrillin family protein n=1 Tax=Prevotella sp. 10(H) TaxID=1158294 RepID=UPI0004A728F9|nr:fimbrillin family protein [Prevotella sp. 10(H)]